MEKAQKFDYLICLSIETTRTQGDYRELIENQKEHMINKEELMKDPKFPNIIEFDWISYCLEDKKSEKEQTQHFVKPTNMEHLNSKTVELTGVTQEDIDRAEPLERVLTKFSDFVSNSFLLKNKSYCIITFGHWELAYQLLIEASQKKINLDNCFTTFFDVRSEFRKKYPNHTESINKIDQLLDAMRLKRRFDVIKTSKVSEIN